MSQALKGELNQIRGWAIIGVVGGNQIIPHHTLRNSQAVSGFALGQSRLFNQFTQISGVWVVLTDVRGHCYSKSLLLQKAPLQGLGLGYLSKAAIRAITAMIIATQGCHLASFCSLTVSARSFSVSILMRSSSAILSSLFKFISSLLGRFGLPKRYCLAYGGIIGNNCLIVKPLLNQKY